MATRRPLTDRQREIRSTEGAHRRMQAVETQQSAIREQQHGQQRQDTEASLASDRRNRRITGAVTDKVVSTATPSSNSGLIMTTIFLIFGLIAFYLIVTSATGVNTFMTTLSNALSSISQNKPLFTNK
jgi:Flp pilus assembly protein TadB